MAKAILTLEDNPDGSVHMSWDFDLPLPEDGERPATLAQTIALALNDYLTGHSDIEDAAKSESAHAVDIT